MKKLTTTLLLFNATIINTYASGGDDLINTGWLDTVIGFFSGKIAMGIAVLSVIILMITFIASHGGDETKIRAFKICLGSAIIINAPTIMIKLFGFGMLAW